MENYCGKCGGHRGILVRTVVCENHTGRMDWPKDKKQDPTWVGAAHEESHGDLLCVKCLLNTVGDE